MGEKKKSKEDKARRRSRDEDEDEEMDLAEENNAERELGKKEKKKKKKEKKRKSESGEGSKRKRKKREDSSEESENEEVRNERKKKKRSESLGSAASNVSKKSKKKRVSFAADVVSHRDEDGSGESDVDEIILQEKNRLLKYEEEKKPINLGDGVRLDVGKEKSRALIATFGQSDGRSKSKDLKLGLFQRIGSKSYQKIVYGRMNEVEFEGRNFGPGCSAEEKLTRYLVFRYNRNTKTAELLNTEPSTQFPIQVSSKVVNLPEPAVQLEDEVVEDIEGETEEEKSKRLSLKLYKDRTGKLIENFGNVKAKKTLESRVKNQILSSSIMSVEALNGSLGQFENELEEHEQMKADTRDRSLESLLPPFHKDATTVSRVYLESDLIPSSHRDDLKAVMKGFVAMINDKNKLETMVSEGYVSAYSGDLLMQIADGRIEDKKVAKRILMLIVLIEVHLRFNRLFRKFLPSDLEDISRRLYNISPEFVQWHLDNFTEQGDKARMKSKFHTDRLIIRICACILILERFSVGAEKLKLIAKGFNQNVKWLVTYFAQLGCKISSASKARDGESKKAELTLPLTFPSLERRTKKR